MSITVSIVNYRTGHLLPGCIAAVCARMPHATRIILIDHDTAPLPHLPSTIPLTIIRQDNRGFGAGHNRAARETTDDFLLFLNPDALLVENIDPLLTHFTQSSTGIVGPLLTDRHDTPDPFCTGRDHTLARTIGNHLHTPHLPMIPTPVDWVSGAALLVRRETFLMVNGFDERYFMYFEDADLCRRVRQAGYVVLFDPTVAVRHESGGSFRDVTTQKSAYDASQDLYFQTYRTPIETSLAAILRALVRRARRP